MKTRIILSVMVGILSFLAGCQEQARLALNLQPQSEVSYRVIIESGKDYEFLQPSINETTENHTRNRSEMVFAQKTESIDENGNAVVNITIKELKYLATGPKGTTIDFDSTRAKDKSNQLAKLIGQSYKIEITPNGQVKVLDTAAIKGIVKSGFAGKVAKNLLSTTGIEERHRVLALIDAGDKIAKKGDTWSSLTASPAGMLQSKSYEKQYTVQEIKKRNDQQIAVITMDATTSSKRASDLPDGAKGMGFFAKMFEDTDTYTGKLELNLSTGQIIQYQELLKAEWVAAEPPEEQKSDKGPDTLTMGFTQLYSIEMIND